MRPVGLPDFLYRILGHLTKFNHKIVKLIKDWFQHFTRAESNRKCPMRQLKTPGATRNTVWSQDVLQALRRFNHEHQWEIFPHLCDPLCTKRRAPGRISKYCGGLSYTFPAAMMQGLDSNHCLANKKVNPPLLMFGIMIAYRPAKQ